MATQVLTTPSDSPKFSAVFIDSRVAAIRLVLTHTVEKHHEKNNY
jgi:hypothetical protein